MPQTVNLPGGQTATFPDDMSRQQIESVLQQRFGTPQAQPVAQAEEESFGRQILQNIVGGLDIAASSILGIGEQALAGAGGLAKTITSGVEAGAETIEQIQEAIPTGPFTERGQQIAGSIGQTLQTGARANIPLVSPASQILTGEASQSVADKVFEATDSPGLAAATKTVLGAAEIFAGQKGAKFAGVRDRPKVSKKDITKALVEAEVPPETSRLAATQIFDEIDSLGVRIKPEAYGDFVKQLNAVAKKAKISEISTEKATKAMDLIRSRVGQEVTLDDFTDMRGELDNLRSLPDRNEARVAGVLVDEIDRFLSTEKKGAFNIPEGANINLGEKFKSAREMWGKYRKGQELEQMFDVAELGKTGNFTDRLQNEFLKLAKNKKRLRFYSKDEVSAIREVAQGKITQKTLDFLSKFSPTKNPIAVGFGDAILGGITGSTNVLWVPAIGMVSRALGSRLRKNNAEFASAVIKSGKNALGIASAYLRHTPKKLRSADELTMLMAQPGVNPQNILDNVGSTPMMRQAAQRALDIKAQLEASLVAQGARGLQQEQPSQ